MTQMAFLTLMASGIVFIRTFLWCSPRFKILGAIESDDLVHFRETGVKVLPDTH